MINSRTGLLLSRAEARFEQIATARIAVSRWFEPATIGLWARSWGWRWPGQTGETPAL